MMNIEHLMLEAENKLDKCIGFLRRPFALKVRGMKEKIPENALPSEKIRLQSKQAYAFMYQQIQEITKLFIEYLEQIYKYIKKGRTAKGKSLTTIEPICYEKLAPWEEIKKLPTELQKICQNIVEELQKTANDIIERCNKCNNKNMKNKSTEEILPEFMAYILRLRKIMLTSREQKILVKRDFEKYLKKVNRGLALENNPKYGKLNCEFDDNEQPISCKFNVHWMKELTRDKITKERIEAIMKMLHS